MSTEVAGKINQYIELVGRNDKIVERDVQHIINISGDTPVIDEIDKDFIGFDSAESYWSLYDSGTEFHWKDGVLKAVTLYTQQDSEYKPYATPLFADFSNTATREEIVRYLGTPNNEAKQNSTWVRSAWIQYDEKGGNWVHFEFDGDMHLKMVTICVPVG
ncbi:hypothetical protein [Actinomyces sp. oral taxon 849]|uniref:hypothetical protein n=1 Tax=Actinomyces sp. oral taxon 849 TaxID=653385 RepID=UPI0012EAF00B|nr:hypothetical protein [Actinomyces sp. oral taxon 849]